MPKILVIEDEAVFSDLISAFLETEGHSVEVTDNGQDATDLLERYKYDLIISDWMLPDMEGIDVIRRFRSSGDNTPVLMLTARGKTDDKADGLEAGADDYLTKPFEVKELAARVKALIRRASTSKLAVPQHIQKIANIKLCSTCGGRFGIEAERCAVDDTPLISSQAMTDSMVGTVVGDRYEVLALLASGGMAVVYQGWHKFLNKLVAIKFLQLKYQSDPRHLRRFQLEAQSLGNLKHPNIIAVSDFGMMDTQPYLVMDFINGASLSEIVATSGKLNTDRAVGIFMQICDGVQYAHDQGILHRDLKPSNIMLDKNLDGTETAKIVDFGVAKLLPESGENVEKLTQTGECFGTAHYMSPEQCMGKSLDVRSDIYSMGCIMYEVLSGKVPFAGDNVLDTFQKQIHQPAQTFTETLPGCEIPEPLESVVMKALHKDPAQRQQSMDELKNELLAAHTEI